MHGDDSIDQCTCSSLLELSLLAGINRQWKLGALSIKSLKLSRFFPSDLLCLSYFFAIYLVKLMAVLYERSDDKKLKLRIGLTSKQT